jgi:preprotein translocase subunit YajC
MKLIDSLKSKSQLTVFIYAFLLNIIIGYIDYVTGYDIGISAFYLAPIGLVVWFMHSKKSAGIYMAIITSITITVSNLLAGQMIRYYAVELWNTIVHFAFFAISALLIYEVRSNMERREKLIRELQQALDEVKTLSGLLPMCSSCKKIRDDKGYWSQVEVYISAHSDAMVSHGLCPECARILYPEIYKKIKDKEK